MGKVRPEEGSSLASGHLQSEGLSHPALRPAHCVSLAHCQYPCYWGKTTTMVQKSRLFQNDSVGHPIQNGEAEDGASTQSGEGLLSHPFPPHTHPQFSHDWCLPSCSRRINEENL